MMKRMVLLLALVTFASTAWGESGQTSGNMLKLRKRPSGESVAIEAYPKGEKVDVIGRSEDGKWFKVKVASDRKVGYMCAAFVSLAGQREVPASVEQGEGLGLQLKATRTAGEATTPVEQRVANKARKEKVVSLVARGGEEDMGLQAKYEASRRELATAQQEISSLKQEVTSLKKALISSEKTVAEYRQRLASMEQVVDFRLMSLVEGKGEEVVFTGLGTVKMAEHNGRVIFKVPAEVAEKARSLFGRTNRNMFDGLKCVYVTIDKAHLSLESRKG